MVYVQEEQKDFKSGTRQNQVTMTAMAGVTTLGIIVYLFLNCLQKIRDKTTLKKVIIEDTEI